MAPFEFVSGCVPNYLFPYHDPDTRFCLNDNSSSNLLPCNENYTVILACHECSGPRCREAFGDVFKRTCSSEATSCFTAQDYYGQVERGCWVSGSSASELCRQNENLCHFCSTNYCNDHVLVNTPIPICSGLESCISEPFDPYEDPEFVYNGDETDLTTSGGGITIETNSDSESSKEFSCYQCHSEDLFSQSCDEDVRYLEPQPCAYLYDPRPSSCYILLHRGWLTMERGCSSVLDQYTFESCDSDLFAECKICSKSGCNDLDMRNMLKKPKAKKKLT